MKEEASFYRSLNRELSLFCPPVIVFSTLHLLFECFYTLQGACRLWYLQFLKILEYETRFWLSYLQITVLVYKVPVKYCTRPTAAMTFASHAIVLFDPDRPVKFMEPIYGPGGISLIYVDKLNSVSQPT